MPTRRGWAGLVALLLCGASIAQEKTVATNGTPGAADSGGLATIVARMDEAAQRNRERYRPYVLIREFKLFSNDPQKPAAQVRAETSFVPPSKREFRILDQSGSSRGEGIVRRLLESESNAASSQSGTVSNDNYEFTLHGEASMNGRSCYLLELKARRKEQELVNGQAWVDKETFLIHRIEGEMAKLPSWWLRSVHVAITFEPVSGMWLPTATTAIADVKVAGRRVFMWRALSLQTDTRQTDTRPTDSGRGDGVRAESVEAALKREPSQKSRIAMLPLVALPPPAMVPNRR
ncbi:MAG TPA: outer membrane lipoprotein-sorting protein [Terriglobales bacterium]|nr:outer membrane lipoprotein-sorting protein [Terriglobales bacterium]